MVILPLALVAISLVQEVTGTYQRVKSGQINFGTYFARIVAALPSWATGLLERLGLNDLVVVQDKLTNAIRSAARRSPAARSTSAKTRSI